MDQEPTIIIATESIKVSDLKGREKQIYDYAYNAGYERANGNKWNLIALLCLIILALVVFFINIF